MDDVRLETLTTITKFPVTVRPHNQKGKLSGYYIVAKAFPMGTPELPRQQWVGMHRGYLMLTLDHPAEARTLMSIQTDMGEIPDGVGLIHWFGEVKCYPTKYSAELYVPLTFWNPQPPITAQHTTGHGEYIKGKLGAYVLLHLPAIKYNQ